MGAMRLKGQWGRTTLVGMLCAVGLAGCATASPSVDKVSYVLGQESMVRKLYPDASWLPQPYAQYYPDLRDTVALYTRQSLQRDGVQDPQVKVSIDCTKVTQDAQACQVRVDISPVTDVTRQYARVHPRWLDGERAEQALRGSAACQATTGCWDPAPRENQPWTPFLPLGLPMVTQQSVLFLDYPPLPALTGKDYLNNFTMCRWGRVMGAAGGSNVYAYETIVDARPIAAPGSGEDSYLPDPQTYYNDASASAGYYLTPMLRLLTEQGGKVRPVAVFGSAARTTWGKIVGQSKVSVLDTGTTQLTPTSPSLPWIATNHPDVTSYNCCPGDPDSSCDGSYALLPDEQTDFVAACWILQMADHPGMDPDAAKAACTVRWSSHPGAADQQSLCVQAKLDNNNTAAVCSSYTEAWNYCSAHAGNACASLDCSYDPSKVTTPPPAPAQRPAGWEDTCNEFR